MANVYKGVDLVFHGNESALEYDFVVAPGADPRQIQLQFEGAASLEVDKANGDLVLAAADKTELLRHAQPKIYQEVGGRRVPVKGGFQILKGDTCRIHGRKIRSESAPGDRPNDPLRQVPRWI